MDTLYNKIAYYCENKVVDGKKGISFYRLCKDIGIRQSVLSDLKNNRTTKLSTATLEKLANYFEVPIDELLGNESTKKEPADPLIYMSADRQAAVYELFSERIKALDETEGFVIVRSGVEKNFFPRLANHSLSRVERDSLEKLAAFLDVTDKLEEILSTPDEESETIKEIVSKMRYLSPKDLEYLNGLIDRLI